MSTKRFEHVEQKIRSLDDTKSAEIQALTRQCDDLERRLAAVEENRDPDVEPPAPLKPARIPARPLLMQEMNIGADPA